MAKCLNCGKPVQKALYLLKQGKRLSTSFCCRDCYLEFWKDTPNFEPLPDYPEKKTAKPLSIITNVWWKK